MGARNYMEEVPVTAEQLVGVRKHFVNQVETSILCVMMLIGSLVLTFVGLCASFEVTCITALTVAMVMLLSFSIMLSPIIAKFNAFSLIQTSCTFSISGASFYFFTDNEIQYPDGPHFSPFFYNTVLGVVNGVVSLFGIYCYKRYMADWNFRYILILTNVAGAVLCLLDIILFTRFNKNVLGIPDAVFVLGSTVAEDIVMQWQWMPQVVILSLMCPKGMEATMYALLAGCHNLGNTIASNCGALMLRWLGCTPDGSDNEGANFENLWIGSAIGTVMPLITIVALFWLIPNARPDGMLVSNDGNGATEGSLWRLWTMKGVSPQTPGESRCPDGTDAPFGLLEGE